MNPLPFRMRTDTPLEQWRAETWMQKEPETVAWIESFADDCIFYDIGANVGVYSLLCAAIHPQSRIFAFEPFASSYAALLGNICLNHFGQRITPLCAAIGDYEQPEPINFFSESTCIGSSGGRAGIELQKARRKSLVMGLSLDIIKNQFLLYPPDHVKIDIDGQELAVIHGMTETLWGVQSLLVEVSRASKGAIMEILTAEGFTTDNRFNSMSPHSRERREAAGSDAENIIFTR